MSGILLFIDYNVNFINSKKVTKKRLLSQKQYLAWRVKNIFIAFIYQLKVFFNFFQAT